MVVEKKLLTAEELSRLPDDGSRYELLDGELVEMTPPGGEHGLIQVRLPHRLLTLTEERGLDVLVGGEVGVVLARHPDRVRAPDVFLIIRDRLPEGRMPSGYLDIVPDLIVEIISPSDSASDVHEKIQEWLAAGARLVWALYPSSRSVVVHRGTGEARTFREGDTLNADPVLSGIALPVADIFP